MEIFRYGQKEMQYLKDRDQRLGGVIERLGHIEREVYPDLFAALVNSVIGQQISAQAQRTVWTRVCGLLRSVTPEAVEACPAQELQSCGMSMRKVQYIKQAARMICSGALDWTALADKTDGEVCAELVKLHGVGVWTAEMLLIFSMQRSDIFSRGDAGIQKGLRMLYGHKEITSELFETYRRRYSPYGTAASLYLWEVAAGAVPELTDPAGEKGNRK